MKTSVVNRSDNSINLSIVSILAHPPVYRPCPSSKYDGYPHSLVLEWSPHHSSISDSKFGQTASWDNATLGNIEGVHDRNDVVLACAGSLDVGEQLLGNKVAHVLAEIGRMQGDLALKVVEEEHLDV